MTSIAKIRKTIKRLDEEVQEVKKEFDKAISGLSKSQPLDNKKEKEHGNR